MGWSLEKNVSMAIVPSASPWPPTEVRWIVSVSEAQMPIVYHLVRWSWFVVACICTWSQVPGGVVAFQEATSSLKPKPGLYRGEVQLPLSYAIDALPKGSA